MAVDVGDADDPAEEDADRFADAVAVDAVGNAVATWSQSDGTRNNIWANRFVVGTGWGTAQLLETDNAGNGGSARVAIDARGNATAVWRLAEGTRYDIWANRYEPGVGWGTPVRLETDDAGSAAEPQIAIDSLGNAVAVWRQSDSIRDRLWANLFR